MLGFSICILISLINNSILWAQLFISHHLSLFLFPCYVRHSSNQNNGWVLALNQLAKSDLIFALPQLILSKLVNISAPLFLHLQNKDNISTNSLIHSTVMRVAGAQICEALETVPDTCQRLNDVSYYFYQAF